MRSLATGIGAGTCAMIAGLVLDHYGLGVTTKCIGLALAAATGAALGGNIWRKVSKGDHPQS